jgi:type VI secretion system protein ImpE
MTAAEESIRSGKLQEALASLQAEIKKQPADPRLRVFLFQLLSVMGQWDRAATQLDVASELDPSTVEMAKAYKPLLQCERLRASVFAGRTTPVLFGDPAPWMALLVQALQFTAQGKFSEARDLRDKAFEEAPATMGAIDETPFSWIADADPRLGPMLEAIVNGRYCWIPFSRMSELTFEPPADLRDLAWTPALLTLANGGQTVAFVPTRYPGSELASDGAIVTARSTVWTDCGAETFLGLGQRLFVTDGGEHAVMDVRTIRFDAAVA